MRVNIGCPCLFTYYAPPVFAGKARGAVPPRTSCHRHRPQMPPSPIQNDTIAKIYWKQPISARKGEGAEISRESGW